MLRLNEPRETRETILLRDASNFFLVARRGGGGEKTGLRGKKNFFLKIFLTKKKIPLFPKKNLCLRLPLSNHCWNEAANLKITIPQLITESIAPILCLISVSAHSANFGKCFFPLCYSNSKLRPSEKDNWDYHPVCFTSKKKKK